MGHIMKKTTFNNIHKKLGAKMVEFAGYEMPIQYSSIIAEHKAVRNSVGVFDVSHMGEVFISGDKALEFVQHITINDASKLFPGRVQYSAMCYPDGGIVDDLLVYKISDKEYLLVINASNIDKDVSWMKENNKFGVSINNRSDEYSLLAVQGPNSGEVLKKLIKDMPELEYYHFTRGKIAGIEMLISRTGYTGELGYELYFIGDVAQAEKVWDEIFKAGKEFDIQPVGLAARDSLRLEMGYCLYGNDIDQMISDEKTFPRHGYEICSAGKKVGVITSGTVSPVIEKPIALGYVDKPLNTPGSQVAFKIREKEFPAVVTKLPFVKK
jgi:aminomethyltransferase